MTIQQFLAVAQTQKIDTTNAWGFGGSVYTLYTHQGFEMEFEMKKGRAYFRHLSPESFTNYYINDKEVTKKEFEQALQAL